MKKYALYHMQANAYLGSCLSVVYEPEQAEIATDRLQTPFVLVLVKSRLDLSGIHVVDQLKTEALFDESHPILLRISSECLLGAFGDAHCDCESQRIASLREIEHVGQGIYVHLPQDGQGNGLFYKAKELQLQVMGIDPDGKFVGQKNVSEAAAHLLGAGEPLDKRQYRSLIRVFEELGLKRYAYRAISDNPKKAEALKNQLGVQITGIHSARRAITVENAGEYLAKLYEKSFTLADHELRDIYFAVFSAEEIPGRVLSLLHIIEEDVDAGREFNANGDLLRNIVGIPKARGLRSDHANGIDLLKDAQSYDEYQVEIELQRDEIEKLFEVGVLKAIETLRYEENHFYDLIYFKHVPARSLKIRYAYRLTDRENPSECKFIYKIPIGEKQYRIRAIEVKDREVARLLGDVLSGYERHLLPVFVHNVGLPESRVTVLIKRYNANLRTLSLMGPEENVRKLVTAIAEHIPVKEIPDPSNYRYINRSLSFGFNYDALAGEELALFRARSCG